MAAAGLLIAAGCSAGKAPGDSTDSGSGGLFSNAEAGGGVPGGRVVAVLQLRAPSRDRFVLHGTVPVPEYTYPRGDGQVPLSIRNWDGLTVPTQMEIVSRYANDAMGADVVELLGKVDLPPGTAPGALIEYEIVEDVHAPGPLPIRSDVLDLITRPGSMMVVATDAFGHQYGVDIARNVRQDVGLGTADILRKGRAAVQVKTYDAMVSNSPNVGPPNGALPHLFGVHAYLTAWSMERAISLDLRISNGFSGQDQGDPKDDPMGKVYFRDIELWVPSGWTVRNAVDDPFFGSPRQQGTWTAFPLVKPNQDGTMHVMPSQGQFHRRLSVANVGSEGVGDAYVKEYTLGFAKRGMSPDGGELWSWWNHQTARYFPQRHRLPELDHIGMGTLHSQLTNHHNMLKGHLQAGTPGNFPISFPAFGWAHTWGVKYGGMTGGTEIFLYDGMKVAEAASREGYRSTQFTHRMYTSRHPVTLFNADGSAINVEDVTVQGPNFDYVPCNFFLKLLSGNDPFGFNQAPQYQVNHVQSAGLAPSYENEIMGFGPIDFQHYVRLTRNPKALVWLGNDAISRDDLILASELFRLSYHDMPNSAGGGAQSSGMLSSINFVNAHPNAGFAFGRGHAWGIDAASAAFSIADTEWRNDAMPWLQRIADLVIQGQSSCNGFVQSILRNKILNGQYRGRQSYEQAIVENGLWGLKESVFRDRDGARMAQVEHVLVDSLNAMIGPMAWSSSMNGPHAQLAVQDPDVNATPFCNFVPAGGTMNGADKYQTWSSFAYGYELTGDTTFLDRASDMINNPNLLGQLENEGLTYIEQRAALLAMLQD